MDDDDSPRAALQRAIREVERERTIVSLAAVAACVFATWAFKDLLNPAAVGVVLIAVFGIGLVFDRLCELRLDGFRRDMRAIMQQEMIERMDALDRDLESIRRERSKP